MEKRLKQFGMAGIGVVVGIVIFNNLAALAGNTVIGKILEGKLVRSA